LNPHKTLDDAIQHMPYLAILRGIEPSEVLGVSEVLFESGIRAIEIPINSPEPFESIALLRREVGDRILVGCGTATSVSHVEQAIDAGADLIVHPHSESSLVEIAVQHGKVSIPGICTPTEGFRMLEAGATGLKIFPSEMIPPAAVAAIRAVLPSETRFISVGGISVSNIRSYWEVGVRAFGLGSTIYRKGMTPGQVAEAFAPLAELGQELAHSAGTLVGS
jgi:2-dehydro-3-deoxyphosphogalactonate aldolase